MMTPDIHMSVTRTARELAEELDKKFLEFFGSDEQAQAYAHLFIIEHAPVKIETTSVYNNPLAIGYHVETAIRIRPKTMAELEAEK